MGSVGPRRDRRLTKSERRETFLDAAVEILSEKGIEGLTMEGLASRAGVSKALPYRFFSNRDEVLVALYDRESAAYNERVVDAVNSVPTLEEKLRAAAEVWFDPDVPHRDALFLLDQPCFGPPELEERRWQRLDLFQQFYADRIREAYDIPPQDALTAATILLGGALGLADTWFRKGWPRRPMIDTFVRVSMSAIEGLARPRS